MFYILWIVFKVSFRIQIYLVPYQGSEKAAVLGRRQVGPDVGPYGMGARLRCLSQRSPVWGPTIPASLTGVWVPGLLVKLEPTAWQLERTSPACRNI